MKKTATFIFGLVLASLNLNAQERQVIVGSFSDTTRTIFRNPDNTDVLQWDNGKMQLRNHYDVYTSERDWMRLFVDADSNQTNAQFGIYKDTYSSVTRQADVMFNLDSGPSWINVESLGIGLTAPTEALSVDGAILIGNNNFNTPGVIRYKDDDFEGYTLNGWKSLTATGGGGGMGGADADWEVIGNDMRALPTGNLGIDAPSPASKLSIGHDGAAQRKVSIYSDTPAGITLYAEADSLLALAENYSGYFTNRNRAGAAIYGENTSTDYDVSILGLNKYGGRFKATGNRGIGVKGEADVAAGVSGENTGNGIGVAGTSQGGTAVRGYSLFGTGGFFISEAGDGVNGQTSGDGQSGGLFYSSGHNGIGARVTNDSTGYGMIVSNSAYATASNSALWVISNSATSKAGRFNGDVEIFGSISKSSGSFLIDHPTDPANKYLYHSFVESPDMMNIYNGNVITDEQGLATIPLPDYFADLNKDFRYQLTTIGTFARVMIKEKIQGNSFVILSEDPHVEVSWQVTGVRKDAYAEQNRIPTVVNKPPHERGKYLHPEVFGQSRENCIKCSLE